MTDGARVSYTQGHTVSLSRIPYRERRVLRGLLRLIGRAAKPLHPATVPGAKHASATDVAAQAARLARSSPQRAPALTHAGPKADGRKRGSSHRENIGRFRCVRCGVDCRNAPELLGEAQDQCYCLECAVSQPASTHARLRNVDRERLHQLRGSQGLYRDSW